VALLQRLDFLYMPSRDVEADLAFYTEVLGGDVVFAIEAFGARVARIALGEDGPALLLADHLDGEAPLLVHRVADLDAALAELERRGLAAGARLGIPHGPCAELRTPGGQRLAVYELTRPGADGLLTGRHDFGPGAR
jgi:catechol 2,3-dioxygenase-like lactoylglutathione lyase family enzyme